MNMILAEYPEMCSERAIDPDRDIHNYNLKELKLRFRQFTQVARLDKSARKIQRAWR